MNSWFEFLTAQGARLDAAGVPTFGERPEDYEGLLRQTLLFCPQQQGFIGIEGTDAEKFLQGQTTCDLSRLGPATALSGAVCTAKGRMICNFLLFRTPASGLLMQLHASLVADTLTHLKKYAVFFKTSITDVSARYIGLAISGPTAAAELAPIFPQPIPASVHAASLQDDAVLVRTGRQTFFCFVAAEQASHYWQLLSADCRPAGEDCWQLSQIHEGLGQVTAATREEFIPQMLNLQVTGGISFRKGCYTGQEVVARMQYLGKLKRRLYRLAAATPIVPATGAACYLPDASQSCGNVVGAAQADASHIEMLAVLTLEGSTAPVLVIDDVPYSIRPLPLPYEDQLRAT